MTKTWILPLLLATCASRAGDLDAVSGSPSPVDTGAPLPIDPALGSRTPRSAHARALASAGLIAVHVYTNPTKDRSIGRSIASMPAAPAATRITRTARVADHGFFAIETTPAGARRIAALPGVRWVEQAPEPEARNETLRRIVQIGNADGPAPFDAVGPMNDALNGAGQIVGVIDNPLDRDHCAFDDANPIGPTHRKIQAYNAPLAGVSAHGTHVCGTLLGDSTDGSNLRGVATGARLAFDTIPAFTELTFYEQLETHASQGAFIHSNSWGDEQSAAYGGLARAIDAFTWTNDAHLVVVATSNDETLKTPENAKNALAVSASLDAPFQDRFCVGASGPTADGRRKPDLVAPGCSIFSAYPFGAGCPSVFSSGTSMATPAVAGAGAIARQYFTEGWYPRGEPIASNAFVPSGALLKAVLVAGAADLADEPGWPSAREGWGRVMLAGSLPLGHAAPSRLVVEQRWNNDTDAMSTGDEHGLVFTVEATGVPLRIVLAWHDAPGAFGSTDPVVNDLDLEVIGPGGAVHLGNRIDPATGASVPQHVASSPPDTQNTVEVVSIPNPAPGDYTVRVLASIVASGSQGYGLAVTGGVEPVAVAACGPADLAGPFGVLDLADVSAFLAGFGAQSPDSDLNQDGRFDLQDINAFVAAFISGCV